jgi:hypothetical protein
VFRVERSGCLVYGLETGHDCFTAALGNHAAAAVHACGQAHENRTSLCNETRWQFAVSSTRLSNSQ